MGGCELVGWTLVSAVHAPDKNVCFSCRGFKWSAFLQNQWSCVAWHIDALTLGVDQRSALVNAAEDTLDVAGPDILIACFSALGSLLPKVRITKHVYCIPVKHLIKSPCYERLDHLDWC